MSLEKLSPGELIPLESLPLNVSRETKSEIQKFIDLVFTWKLRTNITGAKTPQEYCHHILDCLWALQVIPEFYYCIDVGSGSGLPGIPWALMRPQAKFTLVEAQRKKAGFLLRVISQLRLKNLEVFSKRFEELKFEEAQLGLGPPIIVSRGTAAPKNLWKLILSSPVPFKDWYVFSNKPLHQEFLTLAQNSAMEVKSLPYKKEGLEGKIKPGKLTRIRPR